MGIPTVTVAIPTRNRPELLGNCIASVLEQTFDDFEVIVSDNASTLDVEAVVAGFEDPRLHYTRLDENIGLHGNLNRCLRLGSAPFVTVLSDDDLMLPDNLARKVRFLDDHPTAALACSDFVDIGPDGAPTTTVNRWHNLPETTLEPGEDFIWRSMQQGGLVCPPTVLLRREALGDDGFDPDDGPFCDNGLWLRLALSWDIGYLAEPLAAFRVHGQSQTVAQYGAATVTGGRYRRTIAHADSMYLPAARFLQHADLPEERGREYWRLLKRQDRRLRFGIRAQAILPRPVISALRRGMVQYDAFMAARATGDGGRQPPDLETPPPRGSEAPSGL